MSPANMLCDRDQLLKECYSDRSVEAGPLKSQGVTTAKGLLPIAAHTNERCIAFPIQIYKPLIVFTNLTTYSESLLELLRVYEACPGLPVVNAERWPQAVKH